jgi:serine/threonine protein kinase
VPAAPVRFGRYQLFERIAVGGMAELFFATAPGDPMLERGCVIKRVLPHLTHDTQFITMFLDEAKVIASLHHPGITRIFDLGKQGEHYFIAMEHLAGKDCCEFLERRLPVPFDVACAIAARAAEALHFAHEARGPDGRLLNLVHRDVSPANLFVTYDGHVKLLDFGIARSTATANTTMDGYVKGKAGYMAPEHLKGLAIDRRADIWSLGVSLYELLIGHVIFTGNESSSLLKDKLRRHAPPSAHVPEIPPELDKVVLKAMAPDWNDRYATAAELAHALAPWVPAADQGVVSGHMFATFGAAAPNPFATADKTDKASPPPEPEVSYFPEPPTVLAAEPWKEAMEAQAAKVKPKPLVNTLDSARTTDEVMKPDGETVMLPPRGRGKAARAGPNWKQAALVGGAVLFAALLLIIARC